MTGKSQPKFVVSIAILAVTAVVVGCSPQQAAPPTNSPTTVPTEDVTEVAAADTTAVVSEEASTSEAASCSKLNLNDLTEDDLMSTIPDFSSRMVREFFEYRPYVSIQQFRREIGKYVDESQVSEYEQYVYVPVDPNEADADTLMQIPGVDEAASASLIEGRPYASNDAFLEVLGENLSAEQLAQSECFLVENA